MKIPGAPLHSSSLWSSLKQQQSLEKLFSEPEASAPIERVFTSKWSNNAPQQSEQSPAEEETVGPAGVSEMQQDLIIFERAYFYRASICEGGLGCGNSVCPPVCQSVTRVDCDKTK